MYICLSVMCSAMCKSIQCMVVWVVAVRGYQYQSRMGAQRHLKCPFCGKTCSCPSNLSVHIRYRHLDSKPFKCSFCEYRWVEVSLPSHWMRNLAQMIILLTLIQDQEVLASNLSWDTSYSGRLFHGSCRPSRQMLGWYLKLGHHNLADSFHFISQLSVF
jgi:hypothetical protein